MKSKSSKVTVWGLRPNERITILLLGDLLAGVLALFISLYYWSMGGEWLKFSWKFLSTRPDFWYYLLPILWIVLLAEIYDIHSASRWKDTLRGVLIAALVCLGIYLIVYFTSTPKSLPRRGVAAFIASAFILTLIWRLIYIRIFTAQPFLRRVLLLGAGSSGNTLVTLLQNLTPIPFEVVGWIDDDPSKIGTNIDGYEVLGGNDCLLDIIDDRGITDVIVAISGELNGAMFQAILDAQENGVVVTTMPVVYEELFNRVPIFHLESDWVFRSFGEQAKTSGFYELAKRIIDIFGGLIGVIGMIIIFPFVSIAILLDTGRPILYRQERLGKGGQTYNIIKFRTMVVESEMDGKARFASEHDTRVTKIGRFLRRSHLDEIPQFLNVLLGQMSLVGPRPERSVMVRELQKKIPFYRARLLVKPGISGWAQINFGYAGTVEDTATKLEYDLYYIKHRNLLLDLVILIRTIGSTVGLKGL
jgi:exopolysaccharide biosynthesis polyprenyl glycosylphosphotransferase